MAIFPYDDEEERRRLLTPGFNPNLPAPMNPTRMPMPVAGNPAAITPPTFPRQGRYGEMQEAKDVYLKGTPGRGRSALSGVLRGAVQGLATGQGLAGAVGGAIGGGLGGAINPRGLREQQFNERIKPQIQERFAYEDAENAARRQAAQDELNNAYKTAQIGELESQAYKNRLPPPTPQPRFGSSPGIGIYNQSTGQVTTPAPQKVEKQPSRIVRNDRGDYVDYYEEKAAGRKVRGYDRPREPKEPKAEAKPKPGSKGNATKEDIDAAFRAAGGHAAGWTLKGMKKHLKDKGYSVPE